MEKTLARKALEHCYLSPSQTRDELRAACLEYINKNNGSKTDCVELENLLKMFY